MLVVPGRLHIPVTNLAWVASDTELAYTADTAHLTSGQQAILDAMVSLFNTIDKVRIVGRSYARHSIGEDPELSALVAEARPGWLESQQPAAAVGGAVAAEQGEQAEQGEPGRLPTASCAHACAPRWARATKVRWATSCP